MYELFAAYAHELVHVHRNNRYQRLLDIASINGLIVEKLLELDATVEYDFPEPFLQTCAQAGSLQCFKYCVKEEQGQRRQCYIERCKVLRLSVRTHR